MSSWAPPPPRGTVAALMQRMLARPREHPLGWRLLGALLAASTALAIVATAALLVLDYRREVASIDDALARMERSQLPSIANSLWAFDSTQLHLQLDGLLQLPSVKYALVTGKRGERFAAGVPDTTQVLTRRFEIRHAAADNALLGSLELTVTLDELFDGMVDKALQLLAASIAGTLLVALVMMWLVRRWVTRHLQDMARYARSLRLDQLGEPLVLAREPGAVPDELDHVVSGLNEMTRALSDELARRAAIIDDRKRAEEQLAHYRDHLEVLVAQRTAELQQAQTQLVHSEKMASIGALAAGVAHEINNPIGFVSGNLGTLSQYAAELLGLVAAYEAQEEAIGRDTPEALQAIRRRKEMIDLAFLREDLADLGRETADGLARVTKIVQDLKDFSRAGEGHWQVCDLHKGLDSTLNIAWNELKYKVDVVKHYGAIPEIECLPSELNQVFMNLFINAAQAITTRGQLRLCTGTGEGGVWIEVADTGGGIAPEHLSRIFEPFFTTKPVGQGTGLGLALSYAIVRKHGGRLEVRSAPGVGTTFRIWLPTSRASPGHAGDEPQQPSSFAQTSLPCRS